LVKTEKLGSGLAFCPADNPIYLGIDQAKVVADGLKEIFI
jgi:hypothetical protein